MKVQKTLQEVLWRVGFIYLNNYSLLNCQKDPSEHAEVLTRTCTESGDSDKDADASSRAILAESEKFVSKLTEDNRDVGMLSVHLER